MTRAPDPYLWRLDAVDLAALVRTGRASAREVTGTGDRLERHLFRRALSLAPMVQ